MDQRSRSSFSVLRLLKVLVLATCAPFTTLSQTVLFHETFDTNSAGEYAFDTNTAFAAKSNGKAYWGVWDEVGDDDDFGGDAPAETQVANFTSYDGNILIGRDMDVPQVGASPGSIVKEDISLLGAPEQLTISIRLAANNAGDSGFEEEDVMRVFVREGASTDWGAPIIDFQGSELLPLSLTLTEFTADFNKPGESLDIKFEMYCDEGNERLAADDFKLIACPDQDGDGICDDDDGCSDLTACNFSDPAATTCLFNDSCGVCDGLGDIYQCGCSDIPEGDCDCNGNQFDALDVCGGDCAADADDDGICDDEDPCVGQLDECGVCNGPGAVLDCGCSDIPAGDCDCDGNVLDAIDVCGGDCAADADNDDICDDEDDCFGTIDACGICNGPGAIYDCGCTDITTGDCDCDGNQLDAIDECGGDCTADADDD
ncbi:hypothetical protein N9H08_00345, partial [bacterium]|nr:hypothetical protein [bacterium]